MRLCSAMQNEGIAVTVHPLLVRQTAVSKSATAGAGQRPGPQEHYDSLGLDPRQPLLSPNERLVIVDDVVTRGATLLAAFARLTEAFPINPVSCFALIRTMSGVDIDAILGPVEGTITFHAGYLHRQP
jgi:predicted amidophosphoribosyltransferase